MKRKTGYLESQALAVLRDEGEDRHEDIDTIAWLSKMINYEFKKIDVKVSFKSRS